jgi:dienelactone hydrolase
VTTTTAAPTNLAVTRITKTFVDRGRATVDPDPAHTRSAPTRTLVTDIYIPAGAGPYPLIVHAHGSGGDARKFTELAGAWARHGYVVAIPNFPLTSDVSGGSVVIGDYVNQPADLHYVLDQVLQLAATPTTPLSGKIDVHHIGLSGLSLGGATAYGFGFNTCCADPRITAVIIMSGVKLPFGKHPYVFDKPILIFHGSADPVIHYSTAPPVYALAAPPKYFVTLIGAGHAPSYENTPDPHDGVVVATSLDFWNTYLKNQAADRAHLLTDADHPSLSTVQHSP